jgi:hypothetical protein
MNYSIIESTELIQVGKVLFAALTFKVEAHFDVQFSEVRFALPGSYTSTQCVSLLDHQSFL